MACLFFVVASNSCILISIALNCAYVNTCTSMDGSTFVPTTSSSLTSIYPIYASSNCCSIASSSSDSSMNTKFINVTSGPVYTFACQCFLLCKNLTADVPVQFISWIIVCTNCILSLYVFPSAHSKDDEECDDDLTINARIFNIPSLFALRNSSSTSFFLYNFASSSSLCLCSLFCASFSFATFCSFSIALSTLMLLWILELKKCSQLPTRNENIFWWSPLFFVLELLAHHIHFFTYPSSFN